MRSSDRKVLTQYTIADFRLQDEFNIYIETYEKIVYNNKDFDLEVFCQMKREMLSERIALNIVETDKFKSNFLSVSFAVPFNKDDAAKNALMLRILKRGTVSHPTMLDLSKKLEYLYSADIFTKTVSLGETQLLQFTLDCLDDRFSLDDADILSEGIKVLGELIFAPVTEDGAFKQAYFESEKRNLLDDIQAEINNKAKYALQRAGEHMFADEAYRIAYTGDFEKVSALSNTEVYSHYLRVLGMANVEIVFVGRADTERLKKDLRAMLMPYAPDRAVQLYTEVKRDVHSVREIREQCIGKQGNLVMGFRTGTVLADGDYPRMALLSELYGGSANSMLFMNVREKMSLCYYCASMPEAVKGIMFVRAGIENGNFAKARDAILAQLEKIRKGDFSEELLQSAKLSLTNAYREIDDNPQSLQNWHLGRLLSGTVQSPAEAIVAVMAITKDEIIATAKKIVLDTVYFLEGVSNGGED